jgi:hypothetical protein
MKINTITEMQPRVPATPAPVVASGGGAATDAGQQPVAAPMPPVAHPAPAPPPPRRGSALNYEVDYHEGSWTTVFSVVDPESGQAVVQIPMEKVLDLVAGLLERLEAESQQ